MKPKQTVAWLCLAWLTLWFATTRAKAWNAAGHRVIASIAYQQLDEPTRQRIATLLRQHPAYESLWQRRPSNGPDPALNLFWNASLFPDDARSGEFTRFNRSKAHYVNFRILTVNGLRIEPPLPGENILNSYVAHVRKLKERKSPAEERALSLSWVFHQAGDIHQPLHAVARFSMALHEGDRGGNSVEVPDPRSENDRSTNLHAYWDNLLGRENDPTAVAKLAQAIEQEHPRATFGPELVKTNIGDWAEESTAAAVSTVYNNLDPEITRFTDLPVGYEADAIRLARRRTALAGYRLAAELERLFGEPEPIRIDQTEARALAQAWTPLFVGVDQLSLKAEEPRLLSADAIRVDLQAQGLEFLVSPSNGDRPLECDGMTTSSFLEKHRLSVAINAAPFAPVVNEEGVPQDVLGLAISGGEVVSLPDPARGAVIISGDRQARIIDQPPEIDGLKGVSSACGGFGRILVDGRVIGPADNLHPRSGVGVSPDGRYLYLLVVDGRQANHSLGVTQKELAQWLQKLGASDGLNLDGGGSSSLVAGAPGGRARILNQPIHGGQPGAERPCPNHLGLHALPLAAEAP